MSESPKIATYPDLQGRVALVTGVGQAGPQSLTTWGNGAAICRVLSHNKTTIIGCDLNLAAAQHTVRRLETEGEGCSVEVADVTNAVEVQRVVDMIVSKYGRIDILVNNVGAAVPGDPGLMSEHDWCKQIDINLKSVFLTCKAVLPIMAKQKSGAIINNASIAGLRYLGKPQVAYSAAKAAVIHYTRVTAAMYAAQGIRVNAVAPGLINTPLVEQYRDSPSQADQELYNKIVNHNVPMGTMGDAFDVANATAFLASESAKYVTGHVLVVDGGLTCSTGT
jgi:NAD(P)-dependent dehydrogenase (short-subunit alcohol dehydrogenase family)